MSNFFGRRCAASVIALSALMPSMASAVEPDKSPGARPERSPLRISSTVELMTQQSSRFSLRARFDEKETAGELREAEGFVMIGRFAKAAVACGSGSGVFENGFEGT